MRGMKSGSCAFLMSENFLSFSLQKTYFNFPSTQNTLTLKIYIFIVVNNNDWSEQKWYVRSIFITGTTSMSVYSPRAGP